MNSSSCACSDARACERLRSVMSRAIAETPMISPAAPMIGDTVDPAAVLAHPYGLERLDGVAAAQALVQVLDLAVVVRIRQLGDRAADHLLRGVAEHALGGGVPARHDAIGRTPDDRIERGADDRLARAQRRLASVLLADVAHVGGEHRLACHVDGRDAELARELAAIGSHRRYLDALTEHRALARHEMVHEAGRVGGAMRRRHDQIDHLPTHHGLTRVPEDAFGRRVELDDRAAVVDRDDTVERRVEHRPGAGVALPCRRLALLVRGDVEHAALHVDGLAGVVAHEHALVAHPCHAAVTPQHAVLDRRLCPTGEHARGLCDHELTIVGMHDAEQEPGTGCPVLRRVPEQRRRPRADVHGRRCRVEAVDVDDQRHAVDETVVVAGRRPKPIRRSRVISDASRRFVLGGHQT
jgi:hypothetical protein